MDGLSFVKTKMANALVEDRPRIVTAESKANIWSAADKGDTVQVKALLGMFSQFLIASILGTKFEVFHEKISNIGSYFELNC